MKSVKKISVAQEPEERKPMQQYDEAISFSGHHIGSFLSCKLISD